MPSRSCRRRCAAKTSKPLRKPCALPWTRASRELWSIRPGRCLCRRWLRRKGGKSPRGRRSSFSRRLATPTSRPCGQCSTASRRSTPCPRTSLPRPGLWWRSVQPSKQPSGLRISVHWRTRWQERCGRVSRCPSWRRQKPSSARGKSFRRRSRVATEQRSRRPCGTRKREGSPLLCWHRPGRRSLMAPVKHFRKRCRAMTSMPSRRLSAMPIPASSLQRSWRRLGKRSLTAPAMRLRGRCRAMTSMPSRRPFVTPMPMGFLPRFWQRLARSLLPALATHLRRRCRAVTPRPSRRPFVTPMPVGFLPRSWKRLAK
mmetsp:Transcript_137960/g.344421  ORF Transcript_137960/g.344421 Transcript_137960/m.344421 type:complete len:314 (+) Transcript_137960:1543-2484(+)